MPPDDPATWEKQIRDWSLTGSLVWAVGSVHPGNLEGLTRWLQGRGDTLGLLARHDRLPLAVRVDSPERVGVDRLLNAVAASSRLRRGAMGRRPRAAVVIDAGTAVTVDLLGPDGAFEGGAIFPGRRLMAAALHDYTALLPLVVGATGRPASRRQEHGRRHRSRHSSRRRRRRQPTDPPATRRPLPAGGPPRPPGNLPDRRRRRSAARLHRQSRYLMAENDPGGAAHRRRGSAVTDAPTIAACLTPPGQGAVAVVAVDGPRAWEVVRPLFRTRTGAEAPTDPLPGRLFVGRLGVEIADDAVLAVRRMGPAPRLELHCHGGRAAVRFVLDLLEARGAARLRLAGAFILHRLGQPPRRGGRRPRPRPNGPHGGDPSRPVSWRLRRRPGFRGAGAGARRRGSGVGGTGAARGPGGAGPPADDSLARGRRRAAERRQKQPRQRPGRLPTQRRGADAGDDARRGDDAAGRRRLAGGIGGHGRAARGGRRTGSDRVCGPRGRRRATRICAFGCSTRRRRRSGPAPRRRPSGL